MMCLSSKPLAESAADGGATPDSTSQLIDKELKLEKQRLECVVGTRLMSCR